MHCLINDIRKKGNICIKENADINLPAFHILVFDLEFKFSVLVGTNHGIAVFDRGIENFLA